MNIAALNTAPQTPTDWCFDMTKAPRGHDVEIPYTVKVDGVDEIRTRPHFYPDRVWIANHDGNVYATYWVRETKHMPGHWSGLTANEPGIAWMKYEKPIHPHFSK